MNFPKTLLAASIAVLFLGTQATAANPMMAAPAAQAAPQQAAALIAKLAAARAAGGLDQNHGFAIAARRPGVTGTTITRVISAADGRVLKQWNSLQTVAGTGKSQYNATVPLNTSLSGSTYSMQDPSRGTGGTYGMMDKVSLVTR